MGLTDASVVGGEQAGRIIYRLIRVAASFQVAASLEGGGMG
jgi:hypothetical protein